MANIYTLETSRLTLRQWQRGDYAEFAKMNADPEVMRYFPDLLSRQQSDALSERFENRITENGWGFWVAERKTDDTFIGLVGLNRVDDLPVAECVEVGWRLARDHWGKGYATEAAAASLHFAFSVLKKDRVAAFTAVANGPSRKVMSRLGMVDRAEDFLHPRVPQVSGLKEHVHYEIGPDRFYDRFKQDCATIY